MRWEEVEEKNITNVFITTDTEVSVEGWADLGKDVFNRDIYGVTSEGKFGIEYQINCLNKYGLKADFFVDALSSCVTGMDPLKKIIQMIQGGNQGIQLHIHTEWLDHMDKPFFVKGSGFNIRDFTEDEQTFLIAKGMEIFNDCGVNNIKAFRAGNYGANFDTLKALHRNGILFDTSYNASYLHKDCGLQKAGLLLQPTLIEGVYEYPITFFVDRPGHYRHVQICACSIQEIENALLMAWNNNWPSFVIVCHSFELIKRKQNNENYAFPDPIVIHRFERLCQFLAKNKDKFRNITFNELSNSHICLNKSVLKPIRSNMLLTMHRFAEQVYRRIPRNDIQQNLF